MLAAARHPTTLVVFDVLHLNGQNLRPLSYGERRALLADLLLVGERWRMAPAWTDRLGDVVDVTRAHELEGVVFKRLDSTYRPGRRSVHWRKLKHRRRETLPVTAGRRATATPTSFTSRESMPTASRCPRAAFRSVSPALIGTDCARRCRSASCPAREDLAFALWQLACN
jgi:hypothetical protein